MAGRHTRLVCIRQWQFTSLRFTLISKIKVQVQVFFFLQYYKSE